MKEAKIKSIIKFFIVINATLTKKMSETFSLFQFQNLVVCLMIVNQIFFDKADSVEILIELFYVKWKLETRSP